MSGRRSKMDALRRIGRGLWVLRWFFVIFVGGPALGWALAEYVPRAIATVFLAALIGTLVLLSAWFAGDDIWDRRMRKGPHP